MISRTTALPRLGLATLGLAIVGLDQWSKWQAVESARNPGIGFGLLATQPRAVTLALSLALLVALWNLGHVSRRSRVEQLAWVAIGAGAISNLVDRWRVGAVIDPLALVPGLPAFNLADAAIVFGVGLLASGWLGLGWPAARRRRSASPSR